MRCIASTAVLAILAMSNLLQVWHVLLASALFGLAEAFFEPAFVSSIPSITPKEVLPSANSLESISRQLASIAGPHSARSLWPQVESHSPLPSTLPRSSLASALRDLREGLHLILKSNWLWVTIAIATFGNVAISGGRTVAKNLAHSRKAESVSLRQLFLLAQVCHRHHQTTQQAQLQPCVKANADILTYVYPKTGQIYLTGKQALRQSGQWIAPIPRAFGVQWRKAGK